MTTSDHVHVLVNAAASNYATQKSNRPICAYCGYTGRTVDTCYKIHGYPVGFEHKLKPQPEKSSYSAKPQSSAKLVIAQMVLTPPTVANNQLSGMINTLSKDQSQGVIAYFNSQLQTSAEHHSSMASTSGGTITALWYGLLFFYIIFCWNFEGNRKFSILSILDNR